ncbi:MAG: single-stranded-DNA-specific exonuclease RecJ [Allisonella histaminiformans]|uniref:single-stranded-DNA-specific exonuclease RecJ n=1 Tax=Allisonella histaminiformans TaxID=209880 RepID=UPI0023570600|nr:single-stranded-DNA-specific exonuclease RecJ [Allisonella histaminiformans]MCI6003673.1 single-stranded-DNA-specific exonuclease RecJ [Allisonella histaminiformans]
MQNKPETDKQQGKYIWKFASAGKDNEIPAFFSIHGISPLVAGILLRRGIDTEDKLKHFCYDTPADLSDPFLMKGMQAAVDRIILALQKKEPLVIYGDYDVDGITATSILYRFLKREGADVRFYIPARETEGYGLNLPAVQKLAEEGCKLLITVDNGIAAADIIAQAPETMDIIVTDHHLVPEKIPNAIAVLNPHQTDCRYPYKELAGCGVAYTVCRALALTLHNEAYEEDMELVAMGTIADVVSLTGENRILVREGLRKMRHTQIPGLAALLRVAGIVKPGEDKPISVEDVSFGLAPRLNAAGRIAHARMGVDLLISYSREKAEHIARNLCEINVKRQAVERGIYEEAVRRLHQLNAEKADVMVIDGHGWNPGVIGISASRILEQYNRPVLMITIKDGIGKGSCRSIPAFDIYQALKAQESLLIQLGGHKMAAGFSIREENIPEFRKAINDYAARVLSPEDFIPELELEEYLPLRELTPRFIHELEILEPCGCDNPRPLFASKNLHVNYTRHMGKDNKHFKCMFEQDNISRQGIFWNTGISSPCRNGDIVSAAYRAEIHEWYGENVQLICKDIIIRPEPFLNRDKMVSFYLTVKRVMDSEGPIEEIQHQVADRLKPSFSFQEVELMFRVFEEIHLLNRRQRGNETYYQYQPAVKKLDLYTSSTYCKYSMRG